MGCDERPEIPQWGISAKNARPVAGPGWQALPGGATRLDSGQKGKVCYGLQAALPTIRPMTASSPYTAAFRLSSI